MQEYKERGTINGVPLPAGMQESEKLPVPVFTPSTKAEQGEHDEQHQLRGRGRHRRKGRRPTWLGRRRSSCTAWRRSSRSTKGIVIADTKFEFGFIDGELRICDEALTMDSSRFGPADEVTLGATPPSFDKQPVRDYAASLGWDKTAPCAADARRGHRRHQRPLHRGLREDHRSAVPLSAWLMGLVLRRRVPFPTQLSRMQGPRIDSHASWRSSRTRPAGPARARPRQLHTHGTIERGSADMGAQFIVILGTVSALRGHALSQEQSARDRQFGAM